MGHEAKKTNYTAGKNLSDKQEGDYYETRQNPIPQRNYNGQTKQSNIFERFYGLPMILAKPKPESEVKAELVKLRFKQVESDSDLQWTESEIFESGEWLSFTGVGEVCTESDEKKKK
ncbi:MAG: hypothetical protein IPJ03_17275 [Ignavibacteriales bacterium]|nr:hypothetical protein [Ignavibacteriales bacterium]